MSIELSRPMTPYNKYKNAKAEVSQLLEVLNYARTNKPEGYFSWEERMAIHHYRASWYRTFEKLEDYDLSDGFPEAAAAIIDVAEPDGFPDHLQRKIKELVGWLEIKRTQNILP